MRKLFFLVVPALVLFSGHSCNSEKSGTQTVENNNSSEPVKEASNFRIISPQNQKYINPAEVLHLSIGKLNDSIYLDSAEVRIDGVLLQKIFDDKLAANLDVKSFAPGLRRMQIKTFAGGKTESLPINMRFVSDIIPENYTYKVKKTYPHDKGAYTQGLEYSEGFLFEGTGNNGESSIRKVNLETGDIIKYRDLSSEFFGEGITLINNKIYQITYRSQVGFVYNENSFEEERKIFYQNKEGWGLCNDGVNILMSDGTHIIYFMDTIYFSVDKKIEVFDNEKEVNLLNELELIDGVLYANRYTTNEIVMIDPTNGKVLGKIDMTGILDAKDKHPRIDYFNGIAYDKQNKRIFVTGKYWPKIYEVDFVKK
ncbi:MAG: glutaminyl-peptide cyclotransferase [Bacteroidales bacterium]|nr:glutaminyl-peptide cyclotransferase [Bacteroidales bacterium]MCF8390779.1 glutaminyl-peptide cyclotransferase [Bacteroidales bacterium]